MSSLILEALSALDNSATEAWENYFTEVALDAQGKSDPVQVAHALRLAKQAEEAASEHWKALIDLRNVAQKAVSFSE